MNDCIADQVLVVSTTGQLRNAISSVNKLTDSENATILLENGNYKNAVNLIISHPRTLIKSRNQNASSVILSGNGMSFSKDVNVIFDIRAKNVTIAHLTLEKTSHHLIHVRGEFGSDGFKLTNSILRDSYQQLLKVTGSNSSKFSDRGIVRKNVFMYSEGIGPNFYIGGIDAHRARKWLVSNNTFYNIASPKDRVAEHAIHFWDGSSDNEVYYNLIINSDRGIGFGLFEQELPTYGGIIAFNRIIHHDTSHPFADVGISLENSPRTIVANNSIYMATDYPNAIEYRFPSTQKVLITNNVTNKAIKSRDGASGQLKNNTSKDTLINFFSSFHYYMKFIKRHLFE